MSIFNRIEFPLFLLGMVAFLALHAAFIWSVLGSYMSFALLSGAFVSFYACMLPLSLLALLLDYKRRPLRV